MKFLGFFLLILLVFSAKVGTAELLEDQEKLREIKQKIEINKQKLFETKRKEEIALAKLVITNKKLTQAQQNLSRANRKIAVNQDQIQKLSTDLRSTYQYLTSKSEALKSRIKEVYKSSSVNYLELLFSSANMSDFINRAYFFSKIIELDTSLIEDVSKSYTRIHSNKEYLVRTTVEIKELASNIATQKEEIATEAGEMKELYGELKDRRENYEKQIAELEKSSAEMEKIIQTKMAERRQKKEAVVGSTGSLDWPLRGRITSVYGLRRHPYWGGRHVHTGIDVAAPYGEIIRAADGGEVIFSGWWDGYGKAIVIDHGGSISTVYAHMSRLYLQAGNQVKKGQIVGLVGSTGYSTGPHLHFEVRVNGKPQNPSRFLP